MSVQNNSEQVPTHELVTNRQETNSHHLEQAIEELRDQFSRIEKEWLQWRAGVSLVSNNKITNRQEEPSCNARPLQNENRFQENVQSPIVTATSQSDEIDQHINQQQEQQPTMSQLQEVGRVAVPVVQPNDSVTVNTSELYKCSSSFKEYF
jgi:hypothetical protein